LDPLRPAPAGAPVKSECFKLDSRGTRTISALTHPAAFPGIWHLPVPGDDAPRQRHVPGAKPCVSRRHDPRKTEAIIEHIVDPDLQPAAAVK